MCLRGLPSLRFPAQGRAQFELYQKLLALGFAVVQAIGALSLLRPYVDDWSTGWLYTSTVTLVAGATVLTYVRPCHSVLVPNLELDLQVLAQERQGPVLECNALRRCACLDKERRVHGCAPFSSTCASGMFIRRPQRLTPFVGRALPSARAARQAGGGHDMPSRAARRVCLSQG